MPRVGEAEAATFYQLGNPNGEAATGCAINGNKHAEIADRLETIDNAHYGICLRGIARARKIPVSEVQIAGRSDFRSSMFCHYLSRTFGRASLTPRR